MTGKRLFLAACLSVFVFAVPSWAAKKASKRATAQTAEKNTAAAACKRDAMRLLSLAKSASAWTIVDAQEDAHYATYTVQRDEERGEIGWMKNSGPGAVQNCSVVITKNGKATYSFEDEAPASSRNPSFFSEKLRRGSRSRK